MLQGASLLAARVAGPLQGLSRLHVLGPKRSQELRLLVEGHGLDSCRSAVLHLATWETAGSFLTSGAQGGDALSKGECFPCLPAKQASYTSMEVSVQVQTKAFNHQLVLCAWNAVVRHRLMMRSGECGPNVD